MSKAEERALEVFPLKIDGDSRGSYDSNVVKRIVYQQGYEQAEKDLELTWKDISSINNIVTKMLNACGNSVLYDTEIKFCQEVLKHFKNYKEQKEK